MKMLAICDIDRCGASTIEALAVQESLRSVSVRRRAFESAGRAFRSSMEIPALMGTSLEQYIAYCNECIALQEDNDRRELCFRYFDAEDIPASALNTTASTPRKVQTTEHYMHVKEEKRGKFTGTVKLEDGSTGSSSVKCGQVNRLKKLLEGPNIYELLRVKETASENELKKAYRQIVLEYHPDKKGSVGEKEEEESEQFLQIQECYEAIMDRQFRRQYDSALPFDEADAVENVEFVTDANHLDLFKPWFERNARLSCKRPVPEIGDANSRDEDVEKFYHFWFHFETWRVFAKDDEYNLNDAEDRYERRYMQRQNEKIRQKLLNNEHKRIQNIVNMAYETDPRIRAIKERKINRKGKNKKGTNVSLGGVQYVGDTKFVGSTQSVGDAKFVGDTQSVTILTREEEEKLQTTGKKWRKNLLQIINYCNNVVLNSSSTEFALEIAPVKKFLESSTPTDISILALSCRATLVSAADCPGSPFVAVKETPTLQDILKGPFNVKTVSKKADSADNIKYQDNCLLLDFTTANIALPVLQHMRELTRDNDTRSSSTVCDTKLSSTVYDTHSSSTVYDTHSSSTVYDNHSSSIVYDTHSSVTVCDTKLSSTVYNNQSSWTDEDIKLLLKKMQKYPIGTKNRYGKIAEDFDGRWTEKDVLVKAKELGSTPHRDLDTTSGRTVSTASTASNSSTSAEYHDYWTESQTKKLVEALARHPASMDTKTRWNAIAKDVPGMSREACVKKYTAIKAALLKQKG